MILEEITKKVEELASVEMGKEKIDLETLNTLISIYKNSKQIIVYDSLLDVIHGAKDALNGLDLSEISKMK